MPGATEVSTSAFGDADHQGHGRVDARRLTALRLAMTLSLSAGRADLGAVDTPLLVVALASRRRR